MTPHRRNRQRRPARRAPFRDPLPVILVVCEGRNTEPQYINGYTRACHNPRVHVRVADDHGVPKTLVEKAKELKEAAASEARRQGDDNLAYDEVWCVFDVDDHPNVANTKVMAHDNGIKLAISNPCFELWLLLHFQDSPGMQDRARIRRLLCTHIPAYDKTITFATFASRVAVAAIRAFRMDRAAEEVNEPGRNPTTGVYKLLEVIGDPNEDQSQTNAKGPPR